MSVAKRFIKKFESTIKKGIAALRKGASYLKPSDDWVEGVRLRILTTLHPIFNFLGRPLTFHCHDEDYMYRVAKGSDTVEKAIHPTYQRNLSSTRKYRYIDEHGKPVPKGEEDTDSTKQWAVGSWVLDPDDTEWQHHVYLFNAGSFGDQYCDIYGHKEPSAEIDPSEHTSGWQRFGDPDENVLPLLADAGITRLN